MQLTAAFVQQVKPPLPGPDGKGRQVFFRDSECVGFALRVTSSGTKSYILERRIRGKVKRITLGRYGQIEFEKARARAHKLIGEIKRENSPHTTRRSVTHGGFTLQDAYNAYLAAHPDLGQRSLEDYQRSMHGPLRDWLNIPIKELKEQDILGKYRQYRQQGQARCTNAMHLLRAILNYAQRHLITEDLRPVISNNPVEILSRRGLWYPTGSPKKHSFIKPEQLKQWWQATLQLRNKTSRDYLQFLLLSGLPHTAVSRLRFSDIDFDNKLIRLGDESERTFRPLLPLSGYLHRLLQARAQKAANASDYVFPGLKKVNPLSDPRTAIKQVRQSSSVFFTLKDLHRTFMQFAEKVHSNQSTSTLLATLLHLRPITQRDDAISQLREIQEQVSLAIFKLINEPA